MLSYCRLNFQHNLMSTVTSLQQYQKHYLELRTLLCELYQQISASENNLDIKPFSSIAAILVQEVSTCLKKCTEREDLELLSSLDEFSCQQCREILFKPITLLCGHTFCYSCVHEKKTQNCVVCGAAIAKGKLEVFRTNITLSNVLHKWHSSEVAARAFDANGLLFVKEGNYLEAVKEFTQALTYAPNNHTVLVNRAEAYLVLREYSKAYKDAQKAVRLANSWSKAHYIKAEICYKLQYYEEALLSFAISFVLDPNRDTIKQKIVSIVENLLSITKPRFNRQDNQCLKRRISEDIESPVPVKHAFCRRSMEDYGIGEKFPRSLSHTCLDLKHSSQPTKTDMEIDLPQSDPCGTLISHDTEQALDQAIFTHLTINGGFSTNKIVVPTRDVDPLLIDASDFECSLCFRLLHNPVCTPCGHTFCQFCIERSLDHGTKCPLCKQSIEDSLAEQLARLHPNCDYVTNSIIKLYLPKQHEEREKQHKDEIEDLNQNQPIFVCTLAFPSVPCPLHIFEPRYRLMLRRCLEFNKKEFGMCMPESGTHCRTGTLLKVHNVTYFPDGRSVVECSGVRRFKTTGCHVKDGYNVAKINYIVDRESRDPAATDELSDKVYNAASAWYNSLPSNVKETISRHFGAFPEKDQSNDGENGPDWHWWILAVMPVENRVKTTVLGKDSFHDRLLIMHRIFLCLQKRSADKENPQSSQSS